MFVFKTFEHELFSSKLSRYTLHHTVLSLLCWGHICLPPTQMGKTACIYISSDKPQRRRIACWWRNFKLKWLLRPILLLLRLNIRSYKLTPPYMDTQRGGDTVNLLWDVCSFSCPIMFPVCFGSDQQQPMVWPFTSPVSKIPVSSWLEFSVFSKGFFVSAALIKRTLWRNDGKFLHLTFLYCYTQRASLLEST